MTVVQTSYRETLEAKFREKELRYTKIRDKYAQSMRPVNQQKVSLYKVCDGKIILSGNEPFSFELWDYKVRGSSGGGDYESSKCKLSPEIKYT